LLADATQAGEFGHLSFISRPGGAGGSGVLARGEHGGGARMTGVIRLRRPMAGRYLRKGRSHAMVRYAGKYFEIGNTGAGVVPVRSGSGPARGPRRGPFAIEVAAGPRRGTVRLAPS